MTDHLPECYLANVMGPCICDRLRAHGKRVMAAVVNTGAGAAADIEFGRQEGLREARDAVAAAFPADKATYRWQALAAIDALKEKP